MPDTFTYITKTVLGANAQSVTLSSIPTTYDDLYIVASMRQTNSDNYNTIDLIFNGNASTQYGNIQWEWDGSTVVGYVGYSNAGRIPTRATGNNSAANYFAYFYGLLTNYAVVGWEKELLYRNATSWDGNYGTAGNIYGQRMATNYSNGTAAITSITFRRTDSVNLATGSSFYLYGIKRA